MIKAKGFDGDYTLVDRDGKPVAMNSEHADFRGDVRTIVGGKAPHKSSSEGKVWYAAGSGTLEVYPSCYDMKWVKL